MRTYDRSSGDNPVQADIVAAGELVLRLCVGVVVRVAVLEERESEFGAAGPLAIPIAGFLCFLATVSLETRPPVVVATPEPIRASGDAKSQNSLP